MPKCPQFERNMAKCNCSYAGCPTKGTCCDCLHKHLAMKQLPACCFPDDVEATYDRSFQAFIRAWS